MSTADSICAICYNFSSVVFVSLFAHSQWTLLLFCSLFPPTCQPVSIWRPATHSWDFRGLHRSTSLVGESPSLLTVWTETCTVCSMKHFSIGDMFQTLDLTPTGTTANLFQTESALYNSRGRGTASSFWTLILKLCHTRNLIQVPNYWPLLKSRGSSSW